MLFCGWESSTSDGTQLLLKVACLVFLVFNGLGVSSDDLLEVNDSRLGAQSCEQGIGSIGGMVEGGREDAATPRWCAFGT